MAIAYTYDDAARREDLLDIITNIDFKENQLMSGLPVSSANDILHQWLKDTLKTPGDNAFTEVVDASYPARTNPSRLTNWCQIIRVGYSVSDTERVTVAAGEANDRYAYEAKKAMKEWKQDAEFAVLRGSLSCGSGSSARRLKGIKTWLTLTTSQSGVSLTENTLNDYLQNPWSTGVEVNAIYVPMYLKRKISGFTANSTKFTDVTDRRLVAAVDVYAADAAKMVKLFAHKFMSGQTGDTNYDIMGINEDYFKLAYLRKPNMRELAKTGDSTNGEVFGELTVECLHDSAGFLGQRHL